MSYGTPSKPAMGAHRKKYVPFPALSMRNPPAPSMSDLDSRFWHCREFPWTPSPFPLVPLCGFPPPLQRTKCSPALGARHLRAGETGDRTTLAPPPPWSIEPRTFPGLPVDRPTEKALLYAWGGGGASPRPSGASLAEEGWGVYFETMPSPPPTWFPASPAGRVGPLHREYPTSSG